MNLYTCILRYEYPPSHWGDKLTIQTASEIIGAEDEEEARHLFYELHRHGLQRRNIAPTEVEVRAMRYNINASKGRYYGAPPP